MTPMQGDGGAPDQPNWLVGISPTARSHLRTTLPLVRKSFLPLTEPFVYYGAQSGFGGRPYLRSGMEHPIRPNCQRPMTPLMQSRTD